MKELKLEQKMQFLPYFPYGICSRYAVSISGKLNPYCYRILLSDGNEDLQSQCVSYKANATTRARYHCTKGYAKERVWKCGSPAEPRTFRVLTKAGLQAVTEASDRAVAQITEDDADLVTAHDGNIKETNQRAVSKATDTLRADLHDYANAPAEEYHDDFMALLLDAVIAGRAIPLTAGLPYIKNTKISNIKYSPFQIYNIWRYSHIYAMFRANDHLTYMDRRPYDNGFAIDGITDEESYQAYVKKHGCTMAAFTYRTLTDWYASNPGFYRITQQEPDTSEEAYQEWLNTPAFYSSRELPNINDKEQGDYEEGPIGSQKKLNAITIGIAIGKKVNYLCYHGKPGPLSWIAPREQRSKSEAQSCVLHMKTQCPELKCNDAVEYALYFCTTHYQFLALFESTKEKFKKDKSSKHPMIKPYSSVHAIPVNDAGTFLLWWLLEESPTAVRHSICNSLVNRNIGFSHRTDMVFPLSYKGKRVFAGYTMDIIAIHTALEEYLNGHEFYLCCFAEQAKWYSMLFPGITIL